MRFAVFTTATLLGTACSQQSPVIQGTVTDHRSQPLAGVEVRVLKSAFSSTTRGDGGYSVPYAPGSFQVEYAKDGHTTEIVDLDIQVAMTFPSEKIELLPIPTEPGVYVLSESGMESLSRAKFEWERTGLYGPTAAKKAFCTGDGGPKIPAGRVRVIDTRPDPLTPARLGGFGLVMQQSWGDQESYMGLLEDTASEAGVEKILVRTFDAKSGSYAFVPTPQQNESGMNFGRADACWTFTVQ